MTQLSPTAGYDPQGNGDDGAGSGDQGPVPGRPFGKYLVLDQLATGGMAEIFLARVSGMLGFDKLVVLKRMLPQLAKRSDFVQMFLDEARLAISMSHPNVVQTYEVDLVGRSYCLVMEHLPGEDVRALLRQSLARHERVPVEHALTIVAGVAAGLQYAHELRDFEGKPIELIHRDVSPQNVIVTYDGSVKLLDFGIAKAADRITETRTRSLKGKISYMSPEQCRVEKLDRRSDIFSLGIVLFELALTRKMFDGSTEYKTLKQIAEGEVPRPSELEPGFDPKLEAIILRALAPKREDRYATARELHTDLLEFARERQLQLSPLALGDYLRRMFPERSTALAGAMASNDLMEARARIATLRDAREADAHEEMEIVPASPALDLQFHEEPDAAVEEPPPELTVEPVAEPEQVQPRSRRGWLLGGLVLGLGVAVTMLWPRAIAPHEPAVPVVPAIAAPVAPPVVEPVAPATPIESPPAVATSDARAVLLVESVPTHSHIVVDGRESALRTPARLSGLSAGKHVITVRSSGVGHASETVMLAGGESRELHFRINASAPAPNAAKAVEPVVSAPAAAVAAGPPGSLVLATNPWCHVRIDGVDRGITPLEIKLPAGPHRVLFENSEFGVHREQVIPIRSGETLRRKLDFAPEAR